RAARVPVRRLDGHRRQRCDDVAGQPRRSWSDRGGHRPRPRRALPRHRVRDRLGARSVRRRRARLRRAGRRRARRLNAEPAMTTVQQLEAPPAPISELVLVDQHEAQGWRVRRDERLDRLFEERCDWVCTYGRGGQLAMDADDVSLTYSELDARANRLARYLRLHGAGAGDRIALLFEQPVDAYIAMLGVLKIGAAYVPLDVGFPVDRIAHIVEDAGVRTVLSTSSPAGPGERD